MTWLHVSRRALTVDVNFRSLVADNVKSIVDRAETMACKQERERVRSFVVSASRTIDILFTALREPAFPAEREHGPGVPNSYKSDL